MDYSKKETNRKMYDCEIKAINGIKLILQGKLNGAYNEFYNVYMSIANDISQLKHVVNYEKIGTALAYLASKITDIDVAEPVSCISYMCLSKAIKRNANNIQCVKLRVTLLCNKDPLHSTVEKALNIKYISPLLYDPAAAYDALYLMQYYDLKMHPELKSNDNFYLNIENEIDSMFHTDYLDKKGVKDLTEKGKKNHIKTLEFLENKIINNEDIDF